jgi:ABC-type sugar transport system ATPase subunit
MSFLKLSGVEKKTKDKFSVKDVSFKQSPSEKIAIVGETGSGKTTLLKMIAGLVQPTSGEITLNKERVVGPEEKLIPGHPKIAYLSQHFELRNNYWVYEILEYANRLTQKEADDLFIVCRIQHLLDRRTDQLSGGEKQRIALARLLIGAPELLLLDEPFSNLDAIHKSIIKSVVQDIGEKLKITCIMVSHDALDLLSWADTVLVMKNGQIIQNGSPQYVYLQPLNEYCAGLLGEYNIIGGTLLLQLNRILGVQKENKKMLIRPQDILIASSDTNNFKGKIKRILFFGSYYMIDIGIAEQTIRIRATDCFYSVNDNILLSISPQHIRYINPDD